MKRPFITLKFVQTLDGRIAAEDGSSRWISGPSARKFSHKLRAGSDGILVGINTVLKDNSSLTTRLVKGKNPTRIVIDRNLRIPFSAKLLKGTSSAKTLIVTTNKASKKKINTLRRKGIDFIISPSSKRGNIDLTRIIRILYKKGIKRMLVEGGSGVLTSFLKKGYADRIFVIIAPKILGSGLQSINELGIRNIKKAIKLRLKTVKRIGEDIVYEASLK